MLQELLGRYPALVACEKEIVAAKDALIACYKNGGKVLLCGNGGSAADADHIVGELMKGFLKKRPLSAEKREQMLQNCPALTADVLDKLQGGLPAVSLPSLSVLNAAVCNDTDPVLIYAQAVAALGTPADLLIGMSTSGNAENVCNAVMVAKGLGLVTIALTGEGGGKVAHLADITVRVPATETYKIQELHLPVYHYLCAAVEAHFFEQ